MSAFSPEQGGFFADVRMHLRLNGRTLPIGQLCPQYIIINDPCESPPGEAEITLSIDGRQRRWLVLLPEGIKAARPKTPIAPRATANGSTAG